MKKDSPKKNFIYNIIYQLLILIMPLITAPYLSRVVGVEGVGIYSYTYSIVYYFMLLTLLGVNNYGNRTIAKVRDDKEKLSKTFWSIYLIQLIMGITMIIIYLSYVIIFDNQYKLIAIIQTLSILSAILDINWLFFGLEEFKKTITRNSIIKVCSVILILLLVKNQNDLWIYTLIMGCMACISQIMLWIFAVKKIKYVKVTLKDVSKHVKPNLILFLPIIAISLYKMMDKIMLGLLTNITEVGYYGNAEKIINIPLTLITALGTVMLPRISNIVAKNDNSNVERYISKSINFVMFLSLAMCFGLIAIGNNFAPIFFGKEFSKTGILIIMLSITLPFISFANVLRTQYLIPNEKDNIYIKSVFLGATTNLVMNFIFIPKYGSIGACFGTIVAEFSVMFFQAIAIRKDVPVKKYVLNLIPYFMKSLVMFLIIYPLNFITMNDYLRLIIQVLMGMVIYGLLNVKYILSIIDIRKLIDNIKNKIK